MATKKTKQVIVKQTKEEKPDTVVRGLSLEEQETIIQRNRGKDQRVNIYTADQTLIRRFDGYVEESPDWTFRRAEKMGGNIISKEYWVSSKSLITIRAKRTKSSVTEEQKLAATERLRKINAEKQNGVKA